MPVPVSTKSLAIVLLVNLVTIPALAVDLYGNSATAQSTALGGLFRGSSAGLTDMLAMNPAALTSLNGPSIEASALGVFANGSYVNKTTVPGSLKGSNGFAPSAAFGTPVGHSRWALGAGLLPVSMLSGSWQFVDPIGAAGASYGLQTSKSAFLALQSTFAAAFKVSDRISLGVGLGVLYNRNTLVSPYIFQNNALTGLKTLLDLHTSGVGYNGIFGVSARPNRLLEFGAAYKTRTRVRTSGTASGNASQQFAVLGLPFQRDFRYDAEVVNVFPQSASLFVAWRPQSRMGFNTQADWTNWRSAFVNLPVRLTRGTNSDINSLLGSSSLNDSIPLRWRNQLGLRFGGDYKLTEQTQLLAGFSHVNNPVPSSTLSPLTANIMKNALSTGVGYNPGRYRFAIAYQISLPTTEKVGKSILQSGEFDGTRTRLSLQTVVLTTGYRW
jgi:long-chain fatty acid transport protein